VRPALCKQHDFVLATADRGFAHVLGLQVIEMQQRGPPASP